MDYFSYIVSSQLPSYTSHETPTELLNQFTGVRVCFQHTPTRTPQKLFMEKSRNFTKINKIHHTPRRGRTEVSRENHGTSRKSVKETKPRNSKQGRIKKNNLSKNQLSGRRDKSKKATQTTFKLQTSNFKLPTSNDG